MKKMALILGILASALFLASCASNTTQPTDNGAAMHHHHDYKGETN